MSSAAARWSSCVKSSNRLGQEELPQTRILLPVEVIERNSVAKI